MLSQFIWRPFDMSCPGLSEMFVRGETGQLRHRYRGLVVLTLSLSAVSAVLFAALHQSFVSVWTEGRIQWPVRNDILLGAQTILLGLVHCHCSFPGITKQIGAMRYIYFVEGIAFLVLGYFTTRAWGLTGVIVAAIVCALLGSFAYGLRRTRAHFALTWTEVLWQWSAPAVRLLAIATPVAIAAWYASRPLEPWLRLLGGLAVLVPFCALVFLRFGLERELRRELLSHVPVRLRGPTRLLLGSV
jgi:O-antigen/teichoic acid export membrane protein